MGEHVAQFAPLMDGPWCFRGATAADMIGEGKLLEKMPQSLFMLGKT
ncbi:hypothetical protein FLM9_905 [Candidatus Synechococcus spongiarum]|uniref:Uncharacterized protein n=1 Tax=Candidatus Synechococcus spongiarum TaxID=431041 RepID=A0A164YX61_9SYNE|nr:hypothetical protein FLM9_905 [Candidatus Synechococcus spongiarum]